MSEVTFTRLPISLPCPVPVLPGTPDTMRDGDAIPIEERTEACCVDAWWFMGRQVVCDIHCRVACELLNIDYDDLVEESGGCHRYEGTPWEDRPRYDQRDVAMHPPWKDRAA